MQLSILIHVGLEKSTMFELQAYWVLHRNLDIRLFILRPEFGQSNAALQQQNCTNPVSNLLHTALYAQIFRRQAIHGKEGTFQIRLIF